MSDWIEMTLLKTNAFIPEEHYSEVMDRIRELDKHDHLKSGSSWPKDGKSQRWFVRMPNEVEEWGDEPLIVFENLEFEMKYLWIKSKEGETRGTSFEYFSGRAGDEDTFIEAIWPLLRNRYALNEGNENVYFDWVTEGYRFWRWATNPRNGEMVRYQGEVVYNIV